MIPNGEELIVLGLLATTIVGLGCLTYTQYKPKQPDPAQIEYLEYTKKSPEHRYVMESMRACGSNLFVMPGDCVYRAVGKATYEKNGEYGQAVAVAVRDIIEHMTAWKKEHAHDGK